MKKFVSILLSAAFLLGMSISASAQTQTPGITTESGASSDAFGKASAAAI